MSEDGLEATTTTPRTVRRAVTCLAISSAWAAILAVALGLGVVQAPPGASNAVNIVTVAFLALVTWKVAVGRRWARWLFVIVYAFGALAGGIMLLLRPELFAALPKVMVASSLIQLVLQTLAIVLLFMTRSNAWFRSRRRDTPSPRSGAA